MKKTIVDMLAKSSKNVAMKSSESSSWFMCHQPKEPEGLREISKKK